MKIIIKDRKNIKSINREIRRIINQDMIKLIGKRNFKQVKEVEVFVCHRWTKRLLSRNNRKEDLDFKLWDCKNKKVRLWLVPSWLVSLEDVRYGLRHEIVHLKDLMEENLIVLSEKPFVAKYRVNKKTEYKVYDNLPIKKIQDEKYSISWKAFVEYTSKFFPWEYKAHMVSCKRNL
jgi:hypothetical protein